MSDTLVVAISQSGTTTDTNRTVDLVRGRGARVIAIVNRRNSDLTDKADGVLYTSDGRDVEMSVASTKALYSQIAAGFLLAGAIAEIARRHRRRRPCCRRCARCPTPWTRSSTAVPRSAPSRSSSRRSRRYWAIVGNGANRIAANELRIKLSELCYKAIACDSTEDKKHIDLSSEPLILVCAAGLTGSNADDVAKEVAIFRAHKATPIVIASEGEERFSAAVQAIKVPVTHPSARVRAVVHGRSPLRLRSRARHRRAGAAAARGARRDRVGRVVARAAGSAPTVISCCAACGPTLESAGARFFDGLRTGAYDGHLEASTAVRLSSLFRYALGITPARRVPGRVRQDRHAGRRRRRPHDRAHAWHRGADAAGRRDQAPGEDRHRRHLAFGRDAAAGAAGDGGHGRGRAARLAQLPHAAHARRARPRGRRGHRVDPLPHRGRPRDRRRGVRCPSSTAVASRPRSRRGSSAIRCCGARSTPSRSSASCSSSADGSDGRTLIAIPETKDNHCTGITLLHVRFEDRLPVARRAAACCRATATGTRR